MTPRGDAPNVYDLSSDAFRQRGNFVVRGSVIGSPDTPPCTLEVLSFAAKGGLGAEQFAVRITTTAGQPMPMPFMVVVSRFPSLSMPEL